MTNYQSNPVPPAPQQHRPPWQPFAALAAGVGTWLVLHDASASIEAAVLFLALFPRKPDDRR